MNFYSDLSLFSNEDFTRDFLLDLSVITIDETAKKKTTLEVYLDCSILY